MERMQLLQQTIWILCCACLICVPLIVCVLSSLLAEGFYTHFMFGSTLLSLVEGHFHRRSLAVVVV